MAYKRRNRTFEAKLAAKVDAVKAIRKVQVSTGRKRLTHFFEMCAKVLKSF